MVLIWPVKSPRRIHTDAGPGLRFSTLGGRSRARVARTLAFLLLCLGFTHSKGPVRFAEDHRNSSSQIWSRARFGGTNPWSSPEACESLWAAGHRAARKPGQVRIGSWNVHWFPDGGPARAPNGQAGTDISWLACAIAWLNLDALALEEVKADHVARAKLDQLLDDLGKRTRAQWSVYLDACPERSGQHVAWLTSSRTVKVKSVHQYDAIDPEGPACARQLRPGLGIRLKFKGGLDLQAIVVHLKSGVTQRDIDLRRRAWSAISEAMSAAARQARDPDVLVIGDFNSMGCNACSPPYPSRSELGDLDQLLARAELAARRVPTDLACSQYYHRKPGLLDHVVLSQATLPLLADASAHVEGYCKVLNCTAFSGKEPLAYRRLSDHCPIVIQLADRRHD
jgi:endonuclease/exonuclease/phosphatase family metal-dependent hydrolase